MFLFSELYLCFNKDMSHFIKFLFLIIIALPAFSQEVRFPVRNFGPKDYGTNHNSEIYDIIQDKQGYIIAAGSEGIFRYDGNTWQFTEIKKGAWITSVAVNNNGTIFAGSMGDFGILNPDARGRLRYTSLLSLLDENDKMFSIIWKIHCINNLTFFQSEEALFIFDGKDIRVIHPKTSYHLSFKAGNNFYIREREIGIKEWSNNQLEPADESNEFSGMGVFSVLDDENKKAWIITREKGIYSGSFSDHLKSLEKLRLSNENTLLQSQINGAFRLKDGNIALYTKFSGLFVIDRKGVILHHIDKNSGLRDNEIKSAITDNRGRIWLALNNGISCIDYPSLLYKYSFEEGISGNVSAVISFHDTLYAGTTDGLYKSTSVPGKKPFDNIKQVNGQVRSLKTLNNILYIGTDESLYSFNGKQYKKEAEVKAFSLAVDSANNILYCVGNNGIVLYKAGKSLTFLKRYPCESLFIGSAVNPSDNVLWTGTQNKGTAKITGDSLSFYSFENGDGLPAGWVIPVNYNNEILFLTNKGMYRFVDEETIKAGLPDSLQNDPLNYRGYFEPAGFKNTPPGAPVYAFNQTNNGFYFSPDNIIARYNNINQTLFNTPFIGISMGKNNVIYLLNNNIWLGFDDGLICYNENKKINLTDSISCMVRNVYQDDSLIYNGTGFHTSDDSCLFTQPQQLIPEFLFNRNSLTFDFASDYLDKCEYSYRLLPLDTTWTNWSDYPHASFNFLYEGNYTLEVRARTIYGANSNTAQWRFTILTPWYRSWWAYVLYIISGILLFVVILRLNSRRLRQNNIRLERIVEERTTEIREKNSILQVQKEEIESQRDELGKQNVEILHQKKEITDSIEYARRIQTAAIPDLEKTTQYLKDFFVFYRPKDIVSGDFYWIGTLENKPIVIAADCTGHGVPGAFMSMLGIAFLNEIINKERIGSPAEILNRLRHNIIKSLKQKSDEGSRTKDGMDITIVSVDYETSRLAFAGANNSVYLIHKKNVSLSDPDSHRDEDKGESHASTFLHQDQDKQLGTTTTPPGVTNNLTELRPDKMPVAIYSIMEPFKETIIPFQPGDLFYLFSDGYADQFGGPKGKKFMSKHMKELLLNISHLPMADQKNEIEKTFQSWKEGYEQVDDVLVIGVKL